MKVLLVDNGIKGHHLNYIKALTENINAQFVVVLPEKSDEIFAKQVVYKTIESQKRKLSTFLKWVAEIKSIIRKESPDVVIYLYGDLFYRFFGIGLTNNSYRTYIIMHELRNRVLEKMSLRRISRHVHGVVVHSQYIKSEFLKQNIHNVIHIEYPCFLSGKVSLKSAKEYFGIDSDRITIGSIGSTAYYKGLDILLEALNGLNKDFQLIIAGAVNSFDEEYINAHSAGFSDRITRINHYMSDDELCMALCACDIIAIPYRKHFNGASGPLAEGVYYNKCIVGTNFGNIGATIESNHLGYTFLAEDSCSLRMVLENAIDKKFILDPKYEAYRTNLEVKAFVERFRKVIFDS